MANEGTYHIKVQRGCPGHLQSIEATFTHGHFVQ
jgi:hypothetical protein